jgi:signal transduction histidine kinase/CheY-like chemotaxis protein/HPt (histidine-containing phosphotransfer) domain-containing protein
MLKRWYLGLSLRARVTAITVVITTLALAVVAATGIVQIRRQIDDEQRRRADSLALGVARAAELALAVRDTKELNRLAGSFLRDENVLFIALFADDNTQLALASRDAQSWQSFRQGQNAQNRFVAGEAHVERPAQSDEFSGDPDPLTGGGKSDMPPGTETRVPDSHASPWLGRVVVGISNGPAIAAEQFQTRLTVGTTILAATFGSIILYLALSSWLRRLSTLSRASASISRGEFGTQISDRHNDEIGRLAQSFETMRLALQQRDQQLRAFNESLQSQVKERTHDLEVALAAAEDANRAKSLFLANMSHELRTPLNGVIGMVDLLLATEPSAQQRRYCDIAKSSAHSLLELINDILDFSKIEAGKLELESEDFNLHEVVEGVTQLLGERSEKKKLELVCSVGKDVPQIVGGDETRLRQVILNLASNAIKFTQSGSVVISVEARERTDAGIVLKFSVHDTGIGIPKDRLTRLFKSFSQIDASTTRRFGGTGLGLAISQRIVEMMGGQIGVESEEGKGSTFWFTARFKSYISAASTLRDAHIDPRGLRALVVDDNHTSRTILHEQLASWLLRPDVAENGKAARQMLHEAAAAGDPYRFVILDMHIPADDSFALATQIKDSALLRDIILISLSAMSDPMRPARNARQGFSACLTKPTLPSQLYNAIIGSLVADQVAPDTTEAEAPPMIQSARLAGVKLLVAEDNEINRFVASELVTQLGASPTMVVNGKEALQAALAGEYDAILMDCQMPEMDGFEATRRIREAETSGDAAGHRKIIALTANAIKGDRELCLGAGMDGYVSKPIEPDELVSAILTVLTPERRQHIERGAQPKENSAKPSAGTETPLAVEPQIVPSASPPLNLESLEKRCLGNRKIAARALSKFDSVVTQDITALVGAIGARDSIAVAASAHKIKGAAANVSAEDLSRIAAELETLARADQLDQTQKCVDRLQAEMNRVREFLTSALPGLAPAEGDQAGAVTARIPAAS